MRVKTRIINKHDTEANWNLAKNFYPQPGEIIIYDIDETHDYERIKIGDGLRLPKDLPFVIDDKALKAVEDESIRAQSVENLIKVILANKVDKVAGKGLSSNDFTIEEKLKLASLTAFSIDDELSDISENVVPNKVITQALLTKQDKILGGIRQIAGFDVSGNLVARDFASLDEVLGVDEVNEICGLLAYITRPNEWGTTVIAKRFKYAENTYGTTVII